MLINLIFGWNGQIVRKIPFTKKDTKETGNLRSTKLNTYFKPFLACVASQTNSSKHLEDK